MTRWQLYLRLASFVAYAGSGAIVLLAMTWTSIPALERRTRGEPGPTNWTAIAGMALQALAAVAISSFANRVALTSDPLPLAAALLLAPASAGLFAACAIVQPRAGDERLITEGPYAIVRHPMYFAFGLLLAATVLLLADWRPLAIAGPLYLTGTGIRIAAEERALRTRYTDAWVQYAARTPRRLIPGLI